MIYDFVIVGSGVAGGRLAWYLCRGGAKCLLLEAGEELRPRDFPDNERDATLQLLWRGGLEPTASGRVLLARGKVLGGGSVVNQAIVDRFDELVWDEWRARSGVPWFTDGDMAPHYAAVEAELEIRSLTPELSGRNAAVFAEGLTRLGYTWGPVRRAQADCGFDGSSDCLFCLGGCPRESKQSTLVTALPKARALGLTVRTGFHVDHLARQDGIVTVHGRGPEGEERFCAGQVFLAAALGNNAILSRSEPAARLPALGKGFACHPQYMAYGQFDMPIDAHKGAFQGARSSDPALRRKGLKFENVIAPPATTALLLPVRGAALQRRMRGYRHSAALEVALWDEPAGQVFDQPVRRDRCAQALHGERPAAAGRGFGSAARDPGSRGSAGCRAVRAADRPASDG